MSLNPPELSPILPSLKQDWTDLNKDGRRIERIIRICEKMAKKQEDPMIRLAFYDRLFKATATKQKLAETVLGVKHVLEEVKKNGV